jgi:hypothetical protein
MAKRNRIFLYVGVAVYVILFILIALVVFDANDESQPISAILQWGYLIPVTIYSVFSLWISFGLFLMLKNRLNRIISFAVSLIIGIPVGLVLLDKMLRFLMV